MVKKTRKAKIGKTVKKHENEYIHLKKKWFYLLVAPIVGPIWLAIEMIILTFEFMFKLMPLICSPIMGVIGLFDKNLEGATAFFVKPSYKGFKKSFKIWDWLYD